MYFYDLFTRRAKWTEKDVMSVLSGRSNIYFDSQAYISMKFGMEGLQTIRRTCIFNMLFTWNTNSTL
jgi:hypothetical protein